MLRSIRRAVLVYHANSSLICKYSVQSPAPQHSAPFEYDRNIVYTHDTHVYCIYLERESTYGYVYFLSNYNNSPIWKPVKLGATPYTVYCMVYLSM